ncbi:MAG TPA: response regulator, partial [Gemmatimonadaceae bacterium]|nr:response regulator [Gemmatimonadaceae bacterium]
CRVHVLLPLTPEAPVAAAPARAADALPRGDETLLVVEDEEPVRHAAVRALRRHGYQVLEARDAEGAERVASLCAQRVSLLVTDVVLPGRGGPQLAARLRARWPALRVLYVSGYASESLDPIELAARGDTLIDKPFLPADLVRAVRGRLDAPICSGPAAQKAST